jgi:hypothetical protein
MPGQRHKVGRAVVVTAPVTTCKDGPLAGIFERHTVGPATGRAPPGGPAHPWAPAPTSLVFLRDQAPVFFTSAWASVKMLRLTMSLYFGALAAVMLPALIWPLMEFSTLACGMAALSADQKSIFL